MKIRYNYSPIRHERSRQFAIVIPLLILAGSSCDNDDSEKTGEAEPGCRITLMNTSQQGDISPSVRYLTFTSTEYTYDDKKNQTGSTYNYKHDLTDGKTETAKVVISNEFDNDGLLVSRITESNSKNFDNVVSVIKTTSDYTYSNNLLVKVETEEFQSGNTQTTVITYEYNGDGKVTKYAVNDGSNKIIEYNGHAISKITHVSENGEVSIRTYQFNDNGFLTGVIESGAEEREYKYEVDDSGQVIRGEFYVNGKRHYAFTQTFDTNESVLQLTMPKIKGQPYIPDTYPEVINKNNLIKRQIFMPNDNYSDWVLTATEEHVFDYMLGNYPTRRLSAILQDGVMTSEMQALYVIKCD